MLKPRVEIARQVSAWAKGLESGIAVNDKKVNNKTKELDPANPDDRQKLRDYSEKAAAEIFGDNYQASDFDESELASGDIELLGKSDAELYPSELEEYTPKERRRAFQVHDGDNKDRN